MAVASPRRRRRRAGRVLLVNPEARRGGEALDGDLARLREAAIAVPRTPSGRREEIERDIRRRHGQGRLRHRLRRRRQPLPRGAGARCATGLTLGILPMGTANDLARTLGIPDELEAAADVILAGHRRRIDLGTVNGKPFFNVASIGLQRRAGAGAFDAG